MRHQRDAGKQHGGSAWQVLEHCRVLLKQHNAKQLLDSDAVLVELRTLISWFPELRTIQLLEQLYARASHERTRRSLLAGLTRRHSRCHPGFLRTRPYPPRRPSRSNEYTMDDDDPDPSNLRILVVDDNYDAAVTLSTLLGLEGHQTSTAHNDRPVSLCAISGLLCSCETRKPRSCIQAFSVPAQRAGSETPALLTACWVTDGSIV